jgi:hypothetical protein
MNSAHDYTMSDLACIANRAIAKHEACLLLTVCTPVNAPGVSSAGTISSVKSSDLKKCVLALT